MNAFARIDKESFYRFMSKRREERYEYVRGRIVQQMTGGARGHGVLAFRIAQVLATQLDPTLWSVVPDRDTETLQSVRYPDVVVEPADEPLDSLSTARPAILVEVLSRSTSSIDLDERPAEYMSLDSLDAYIVASQTEPGLLIWERGADGSFPQQPREIEGRATVAKITTRAFTVELPLAVIYRGIGAG